MAIYSIEGTHENCYPGTTVLINKLNIKNQKQLDDTERSYVTFTYTDLEKNTEFKNVDFEFYKSLHYRLFSEIYDWAGKIRTINISKKGAVFSDCKSIESTGNAKFNRLKKLNYLQNMNFSEFLDELTELYNDLNILHPFREGNGRTLRLFITLLVRNAGFDISFSDCDGDFLMIATIKAYQGDLSMLHGILSQIIK